MGEPSLLPMLHYLVLGQQRQDQEELENIHGKPDFFRFMRYSNLFFLNIRDKKRNAPLRTVQLPGKSQGIGQFSLYQCKGMSSTAASHVFCNLASKCVKENWSRTKWGSNCKVTRNKSFIMLSCWISSSNENHFSRPNCTQTLILCKFYLLINHTR